MTPNQFRRCTPTWQARSEQERHEQAEERANNIARRLCEGFEGQFANSPTWEQLATLYA